MFTIGLTFIVAGGTSILGIVHGCYGDKVRTAIKGVWHCAWAASICRLQLLAYADPSCCAIAARSNVPLNCPGSSTAAATNLLRCSTALRRVRRSCMSPCIWPCGQPQVPAQSAALVSGRTSAAACACGPLISLCLPSRTGVLQGSACDEHEYATWPWSIAFGGAMILLSQVGACPAVCNCTAAGQGGAVWAGSEGQRSPRAARATAQLSQ